MSGATLVYDALEEYLRVCLESLDSIPSYDNSLEGRPGCSYVAPGPPPYDVYPCLIVYTSGPAVGDTFPLQPALSPSHRATTHGQVNLVTMTASILRCGWIPGDGEEQEIDPVAVSASARQTSADLWAIWNGIKAAKRNGNLFAPRERELFMDPAVAIAQQGGAVGWQITVRTQLDGFDPGTV